MNIATQFVTPFSGTHIWSSLSTPTQQSQIRTFSLMTALSGKVWHGYEALLLNIEPQDHSKAGTSQRTCTEPKLRYLNEDCEGWSLFGCHGSVTEHWLQKVSWVRLPVTAGLFTFLYLHLITSTFVNFACSIHTL